MFSLFKLLKFLTVLSYLNASKYYPGKSAKLTATCTGKTSEKSELLYRGCNQHELDKAEKAPCDCMMDHFARKLDDGSIVCCHPIVHDACSLTEYKGHYCDRKLCLQDHKCREQPPGSKRCCDELNKPVMYEKCSKRELRGDACEMKFCPKEKCRKTERGNICCDADTVQDIEHRMCTKEQLDKSDTCSVNCNFAGAKCKRVNGKRVCCSADAGTKTTKGTQTVAPTGTIAPTKAPVKETTDAMIEKCPNVQDLKQACNPLKKECECGYDCVEVAPGTFKCCKRTFPNATVGGDCGDDGKCGDDHICVDKVCHDDAQNKLEYQFKNATCQKGDLQTLIFCIEANCCPNGMTCQKKLGDFSGVCCSN